MNENPVSVLVIASHRLRAVRSGVLAVTHARAQTDRKQKPHLVGRVLADVTTGTVRRYHIRYGWLLARAYRSFADEESALHYAQQQAQRYGKSMTILIPEYTLEPTRPIAG